MHPDNTEIKYKDQAIPLRAVPANKQIREEYDIPFIGYELECPICYKGMTLNKNVHTINFNEQGQLTTQPSLVCPFKCGWHVWIKEGTVIDC